MTELFANVDPDRGMTRGLWTRRAIIALFAAIAALAAWGLFGQRSSESTAGGAEAGMVVSGPRTVRGGLHYQATVDITARAGIQHPRLVAADGGFGGAQIKPTEP